MEAQAALVRTNGAVELHTVADIHLYLALIVNPWHAEHVHALRLYEALDDVSFLKLGMLVVDILDRVKYFFHGLQKFCLARMLAFKLLKNFFNLHSSKYLNLK